MNNGDVLLHVLLALVAILAAGRVLGLALRSLGQPAVLGEVIAGILLGPSLLGAVAPQATAFLFPAQILPPLGVLAQFGVIFYMFLVGLELNGELLRSRVHATVTIALAGIAAPFVLGVALSWWLHADYAPENISFNAFAVFMGVALAITAFPVLARILTDRSMEKSGLGVMALGAAAVADVVAWCLLAVAVGITKSQLGSAVWTIALALVFVGVMLGIVGPLARRWLGNLDGDTISPGVTVGVMLALLLAALASEAIGIHAVFGAFLLGAVIPHQGAVARAFTTKLDDVVAILLLPAFFAYTGLRTEIGLVATWQEWAICGVILLVATAGKFGGTFVAARLTGLDGRTSAALGVLMNTRGLMELIVLNIGLDLGVISPTLFAMMVLMALATTLAATPILNRLQPPGLAI